jgi:hypothetical protein
MSKEHTVTKLRQLLQAAEASLSEMQKLSSYLANKLELGWGNLYLGDNSYFAIIKEPTLSSVERLTELLKEKGYSIKKITGRTALDMVRKIATSQSTKMDRSLLKVLHHNAARGHLFKITRSGA